jgi:hypothetical protein
VNSVAALLVTRLLLVQVAVGAFTLVLIAVFASRLLLIDPRVIWASLPLTTAGGLLLFAVTVALTVGLTRPLRKTLSGLTVGSTTIAPDDLLRLDSLPRKLTAFDAGAAFVVALLTLVPPIRPATSDLATQAAIVLLAFTFASAAILPLYVMLRAQVAMVLEVAPLAALREALFVLSERAPDKPYVPRRFVFAVTLPVAFVALGASLLVEAHGRAYEAAAREDDAVAVAHGAFDLVSGSSAGRSAALAAAAAHGFQARVEAGRASVHTFQEDIDRTVTEVPLEDGHAWISFPSPSFSAILWAYGLVAVLGTALAGVLGSRLGHRFASDIGLATRAVRETGAADVLRGSRVRREARFDSVILLMDAIDSLGGVFREFAAAQERAIDARAATERMRGLFLASMSHDLKGPLNAILGFAELVSRSPLSPAQQESLTIIEQRGRELPP